MADKVPGIAQSRRGGGKRTRPRRRQRFAEQHIQSETRYRVARERIEQYRYVLFAAYNATICIIVFLVMVFTLHEEFNSFTDTLGMPIATATSLLIVWFSTSAVRQTMLGAFRLVAGVHGLFLIFYIALHLIYGLAFGGAVATATSGGFILWIVTIIGLFFVSIVDGILFFSTIPKLREEQVIYATYTVERERKMRDSGWFATNALAYQRHLRGGAAGIAPAWANFSPLSADLMSADITNPVVDMSHAEQEEHVDKCYAKFEESVQKMKSSPRLLKRGANAIMNPQ